MHGPACVLQWQAPNVSMIQWHWYAAQIKGHGIIDVVDQQGTSSVFSEALYCCYHLSGPAYTQIE
jgi:hypothetical protein